MNKSSIAEAMKKRSQGKTPSTIAKPVLRRAPTKIPSAVERKPQQGHVENFNIENIVKKLFTKSDDIEVEASIGIFKDNKFIPGLTSIEYFNILKRHLFYISSLSSEPITFDEYSERRIDILKTKDGRQIRRLVILYSTKISIEDYPDPDVDPITGQESIITYQEKKREETYNDYVKGIRYSSSTEENINANKIPKDAVVVFTRHQKRYSFVAKNPQSPYHNVQIDMTIVQERNSKKYEVEIERKPVDKTLQKDYHKRFFEAINMVYESCYLGEVMTLSQKHHIVSKYNQLLFSDNRYNLLNLSSKYENKPINLKIHNILRNNPPVTVKMDGVRAFLLLNKNQAYIFEPKSNLILQYKLDSTFFDSYIDGELRIIYDSNSKIKSIDFYAFDLIIDNGEDVRDKNFNERYQRLKSLGGINTYASIGPKLTYRIKEYSTENSFYSNSKIELARMYSLNTKDADSVDGLIYQSPDQYKNNNTFKWKPVDKMSIDFRLIEMTDDEIEGLNIKDIEDSRLFWVIVAGGNYTVDGEGKFYEIKDEKQIEIAFEDIPPAKRNEIIPIEQFLEPIGKRLCKFEGTEQYPYPGYTILDEPYFLNEITGSISTTYNEKTSFVVEPHDDFVYECVLQGDYFVPVRIRYDKRNPNYIRIAQNVWEDIVKPIHEETLRGEDLRVMRKYHNNAKNDILRSELSPHSTIIDIGSGRGGDLSKWKQAQLSDVLVIEPSQENLNELLERQQYITSDVNIIKYKGGAEDTTKIKNLIKKHDINPGAIVTFFSLTFFPENEKKFKSLIDTINLLPEGGKLIGIVMDGNKVRELLKSSNEFDSDAFSIRSLSKLTDSAYGNKIHITIHDPDTMVDDDEWLFYFDNFSNKLRKKGFVLEKTGFLDNGMQFDHLSENAKMFSSLNRVFVFTKKSMTVPREIKLLKPKEHKKLANPYDESLIYMGVKDSPLNFTDSISECLDKKITRESYSKLTLKSFEQLTSGKLVSKLKMRQRKMFDKKPEEQLKSAYTDFKTRLKNSKEWMGELQLSQLISENEDVNIYVLRVDTKKGLIRPSKVFSKDKTMFSHPNSIVLLTEDDLHYQPVGRLENNEITTFFEENDTFITKLYEQL